jgi:hypothetical protein
MEGAANEKAAQRGSRGEQEDWEGREARHLSLSKGLARALSLSPSMGSLIGPLATFVRGSETTLSKFLTRYLTDAQLPSTLPGLAGSSGPFPAPSPLGFLLGAGSAPRSRRRRSRWTLGGAARQLVAFQFGVLSALALGSSRVIKSISRPWVSCSLNPTQQETALRFLFLAKSLCRVRGTPLTGGRADLAEALKSLRPSGSGTVLGSCDVLDEDSGLPRSARPGEIQSVVSSRLDVPSKGGVVSTEAYLHPDTRAMWCDSHSMIDPEREGSTPEAAFFCSQTEWALSLKRLRDSNMFSALPLNEMARAPDGVIPRAGVFALLKGSGLQRLIIDRRPWNFWERDLPGLRLPHSVCFTKLLLSPDVRIRMHLRDASNYYYNLSVPVERLPFQGVGPSVSRAWWEAGCPASWPLSAIFPDESQSALETTLQPVSLVVLWVTEMELR